MTAEAFRCSSASEARDEPIYGTASFVRRWLFLEQPGAWGRDALLESRIQPDIAAELRRRARAAGIRVVLIRRGVRMSSRQRQCYFVRTDDRDYYQARLELTKVEDLFDIDLMALREGGPVAEASEHPDPLFLVCTHGRHDACCSIKGNQVSRIACAKPDSDAWECSHIGGDRFAANLVCFPHGIYYGRVSPDQVGELMDDYASGTLSLDHFRGRCCYRFPVQAAEYFVRRDTGATAVDALSLIEVVATSEGIRARFGLASGGRAEVEVRVSKEESHRLTCTSPEPQPIPLYELASLSITTE